MYSRRGRGWSRSRHWYARSHFVKSRKSKLTFYLGPMVYAVAYCREDYQEPLAQHGFDDSKVLSHEVRSNLLKRMCTDTASSKNLGWAVHSLSAQDISSGMLRPKASAYNLNSQAHDTTIGLIQQVLDRGVKLSHVYVDTVGPPVSYQAKLTRRFPGVTFTVAKKADSLYPIVSAASICAKVTRDAIITLHDESNGRWGSGYPSDGKTSGWLRESVHPLFGWGGQIRYSWQTVNDVLKKTNGIEVEWADDFDSKGSYNVSQYFNNKAAGGASDDKRAVLPVTTAWFGSSSSDW